MFELMYVFAERYYRPVPASEQSTIEPSGVSGWVEVQGFVAGLVFNIVGVAAVVFLSSDEKRTRRTGWAIGGTLAAITLALLAL